jgi:hypothetical protein
MQPDAIAQLAGRLPGGSIVILRDQRQDHHRGDGVGGARARAAPAAGPQPRGGEHGRRVSPRPCWPPRNAVDTWTATRACSRSTSSGSAGRRRARSPRALLLGNLFRDQLDRYGELGDDRRPLGRGASRRSHGTRSCSTPTTRWSPTSAAADAPLYFGVDDDALALPELQHAADSKHCRPLRQRLRLRRRLPRPPRALPLPHGGLAPPRAAGRRRATSRLRGVRSARFTLHTPRGEARSSSRCPASTTSTTRSGAARSASRSTCRWTTSSPACERSAPAFGAPRRRARRARPRSCCVKNPAGANEVLRTLALEAGELDVLGVLNDRTADGRDVSWVWDADFELLARRVRA